MCFNLSLNVSKTKELIVYYRKQRSKHAPIHIDGAAVEQVDRFKFLGVQNTKDLKWSKYAHSREEDLFPLRRLKKFGMGPQIFKRFYSCTIESILTGCITALCGDSTVFDRMVLESVAGTDQYITGAELPAIQDFYIRWCGRKAWKIIRLNHSSQTIPSASARQAVQEHQVWHQQALEQLQSPSNNTDKELTK